MGGSSQPYLYDAPSRNSAFPYNDFNPRAATQAHYQAEIDRAERSRMRQLQEGKPLINFNAHPDSFMVVQAQQPDHEDMPPNTKRNIVWARWFQLFMRVVQEIAALGILVCVICLKMKNDGPGWMIRIAVRLAFQNGTNIGGLTGIYSPHGMSSLQCTRYTTSFGQLRAAHQGPVLATTSSRSSWTLA
jgi:hypothetical protein